MKEKEEALIDQTDLAQSVSDNIPYEFSEAFLVKPLAPIMVSKEFSTPTEGKQTTDDNGVTAVDYDVEKEVKEVEADFRKGVVLKVPFSYANEMKHDKFPSMEIKVGDIVVFKSKYAVWFDLLKDTMLLKPFDIYAVEKQKNANV